MAQETPLPQAEKEYICERKARGVSLRKIAQELRCSVETTRKWWRNQRDGRIPAECGRPKFGVLSTYPVSIRDKGIELKRAPPIGDRLASSWNSSEMRIILSKSILVMRAFPCCFHEYAQNTYNPATSGSLGQSVTG